MIITGWKRLCYNGRAEYPRRIYLNSRETMLDVNLIRDQFELHYGIHPRLIVRAPGRVNLIGEHTDYNDGFVFPAAIDRATYVAARQRSQSGPFDRGNCER